ncbi:hypothetical protein JTE90_020839 [Oedothorax gibbosus]|uniref:Uncharacterized protein n=1 Tax=Oedothorax gibbosus TaxID=931172 RepID=A0AAV6TYR9_9ARAC|nr:hypothetical protein JTE90_020839 [Oedothorax gibbosus]
MDSNVYNPSIPYIGPLSGQLQPGNLIRVVGVVKTSATCWVSAIICDTLYLLLAWGDGNMFEEIKTNTIALAL